MLKKPAIQTVPSLHLHFRKWLMIFSTSGMESGCLQLVVTTVSFLGASPAVVATNPENRKLHSSLRGDPGHTWETFNLQQRDQSSNCTYGCETIFQSRRIIFSVKCHASISARGRSIEVHA